MPASLALDAAAGGGVFIVDLFFVLATAGAVAMLMQRFRLAIIPGYLLAGVVLGPSAAGLVGTDESLPAISHLAIILLMFGIGLHMELTVLRHRLARLVTAAGVSCAASIALCWPAAAAFGLSAPAALAVAMALSMSSTAVVLREMVERRELHHTAGRISLAILVVQDLLVLVMLAALPAIARWTGTGGELLAGAEQSVGDAPSWVRFVTDASLRVGGIAAIIVVGRIALPFILHESARGKSSEVLMIVSITAALAAALATGALGFSPELGAFLAGFLLSATPFRHQIQGQIGPLRDLFIAVFFTTLGMELDPHTLIDGWWIILLGGTMMSALKVLAIGGTVWALGASAVTAVAVGLALAQAGEFSVVLLNQAQTLGIVDQNAAAHAIGIVILSLVLTPGLITLGRVAGRWLAAAPPAPWFRKELGSVGTVHAGIASPSGARKVIVAGFGPVGRRVTERLELANDEVTVIEFNPATVRDEARHGRRIVFGDASSEEVLRSAGIEDSDAMIVTIPDEEAALRAVATARRLVPGIAIVVRTSTKLRAESIRAHGADCVVSEEEATAEVMQRLVGEHLAEAGGRRAAPESSGP